MLETAVTEWPTITDLEPALEAAQEMFQALSSARFKYTRLLNTNYAPATRDGVPAPRFSEVGTAATFVAQLEGELQQIVREVEGIKQLVAVMALEGVA